MKKTGRVLRYLMAMVLMAVSLQASAATQTPAAEFNHATTGFALTGGHATAACETCHIGGVFKGTPRNCDGCHALGKRVVATPKSSSHIVTDAPCETCHFNSSTWLGARFNHGTAQPGSCQTCHNGRLSMSKPSSHNIGRKASNSCDQCHRTYAWLPASWNHVGATPGQCGTQCHNGVDATAQPFGHSASVQFTTRTKASFSPACDQCHSFIGWTPAPFKHLVGGTCESCHTYAGKSPAHIAIAPGATCDNCHRSRTSWLPASLHTGNEAGICRTCHNTTVQPVSHTKISSLSCDVCHSQATWTTGHSAGQVKSYCGVCHSTDAKAVKEHGQNGSISTTSNFYKCGNCHSTSTWDR